MVGFDSDWLYPPQGNRDVVDQLLRAKKAVSYVELSMNYGHDSFLVQSQDIFQLIQTYLTSQ